MENETEIWRKHPKIDKIEVSTFGRVRTLDRMTSNGRGIYSIKGHVLKQCNDKDGYLMVSVPFDRKWTVKRVHRLIAQTFIANPNGFPMINHKDCNRANNNVENLEWCDNSYNVQYREKFGEGLGNPVLAINLTTLEVSRFRSQIEASRVLGTFNQNVSRVIKGNLTHTHGYWFVNADNNAVDLAKQKLREIGKSKLIAADAESADFVSKVIAEGELNYEACGY